MWIISYWLFPAISAAMWLATLLALFVTWEAHGAPRYPTMENGQTIAFISDIAAQGLKPLFITGAAITTAFFELAFLSERWLRHGGRLARNKRKTDKWLAIMTINFAMCGAAGLILLSVFDSLRYPWVHNGFLILFLAGYLLSAVFVCAEYQLLGIYYREHRILRASFWVKLAFIVIELSLAIAFGATRSHKRNVAAVLEWIIALVFNFYILSFIIDLLPSVRTRHHVPQGERQEAEMSTTTAAYPSEHGDQANLSYEQPLTTDWVGDGTEHYRGHIVSNWMPSASVASENFQFDHGLSYGAVWR